MELPELNKESVEETVEQGKRLIPWLEDPKRCECGSYCDADNQYVAEQAYYVDVWDCPNCDRRYYRDEDESLF